jgi:hypothetical protein
MAKEGYFGNLTSAQETTLSQCASQVAQKCEAELLQEQDLWMWGVKLSGPSFKEGQPDRQQAVVLLKFLRARKFELQESLTMIMNCLKWRKDFKVSSIKEEVFTGGLQGGGLIHGRDTNGCPVTYNFYGKMNFDEIFSAEDGLDKFVRWRVQLQEKAIELLDFEGGVEHIMQVHEYAGDGIYTSSFLRNDAHCDAALQVRLCSRWTRG